MHELAVEVVDPTYGLINSYLLMVYNNNKEVVYQNLLTIFQKMQRDIYFFFFAVRQIRLMVKTLQKGGTIKIVHRPGWVSAYTSPKN